MSLTYTETMEQYAALQKTVSLLKEKQQDLKAFYQATCPKSILFVGCGSSYMLSCAMRTTAATLFDVPVYAFAGGDLWLNLPFYAARMKDALVISFSRSGKTSEVLNVYEAIKALNVNTKFLSVTCIENTPAEAMSDFTLCLPWAFDASVCQTRSVTNLYAAGSMLMGIFADNADIISGFEKMADLGEGFMKKIEPELKKIAAEDWNAGVVLADGPYDGLAEEAALTFKEICQRPSNYYHMLDSRHGPMVVIGKQTVVVILLHTPQRAQEAALVQDVAKKGARIITVSAQPVQLENTVNLSLGQDVSEYALGLLLLNTCQLLTLNKAEFVGCSPDTPDGLDAWIKL